MADTTKLVLKQNGEIIHEFEFSVLEIDENLLYLHLRTPKIHNKPKKLIYQMSIFTNEILEQDFEVLFKKYKIIMDNGFYGEDVNRDEKGLVYAQNFFVFELL